MMSGFKKICGIVGSFLLIVTAFVMIQEIPAMAGEVDLNNPVFSDFNRILFVKAQQNYGHMLDQYNGNNAWVTSNNGLYILENAFRGTKSITNVLANSYCTNGRHQGQKLEGGAFLSPNLNYDATKIVFAYTDGNTSYVWTETSTYHIFTVNIDGTNLTELTDGVYNDMQPAWLPDGRIVFVSERRGGYIRCSDRISPTFTLFTMNSDGSDIRCISYHETNEWWPSVDNDGMIIYTRWDYVDRGATHTHSGWITKTDGHNPKPISLNYTNTGSGTEWGLGNVPLMQMQLHAIPNSSKYMGIGAAHHGQCYGPVIMIDPNIECDDQLATITNLTPENTYPESNGGAAKYGSPWPLSESYFLCAYSPSNNSHWSLYAIDSAQNKTLLYDDATISIQCPIPVKARTKPIAYYCSTTPTGDPPNGVMNLVSVYNTLLPFPTGTTITALRIWQPYAKSTLHANDPYISYENTESAYAGRNSKGLIGTVPVESDGSARFYLPANRPYYFQALNADGVAVQSMRSDAFFVGGQSNQYCDGCHEPRHRASKNPPAKPIAFLRAPSTITPDPVLKDDSQQPNPFFSYPRYIQPILTAKCISCHDGSPAPDLRQGTTNGTTQWFQSYYNLKPYVWLLQTEYPGSDWDRVYPRTEPGKFGALDSPLYTKLKTSPHSTYLTANELHTIVIWLDSGMGQYFGAYTDTTTQNNGGIVAPTIH